MGHSIQFRPSHRSRPPDAQIQQTVWKHPVVARPAAVSIGFDALSKFSEPGNSVCEDRSKAVRLDNVSGWVSCGVQAWLLAGSAAISFENSTILRTRLRL
jgi:hypothetical protein